MVYAWVIFLLLVAVSVIWNVGGVILLTLAIVALCAVGAQPLLDRYHHSRDQKALKAEQRSRQKEEERARRDQDDTLNQLQRQLR